MATPVLPTDGDGKLVPYDSDQIEAMDVKRRGVRDHSHVTYNLGPDGSGCTRKFSCAWEERFNAAIYFAGAVTSWSDSGDLKITRLLPQRDPDFPAWVCTKCEIMPWRFTGTIEEPDDDDDLAEQLPEFERAELVCTYEMVPFDLVTDDELDSELKEQSRYVTWPGYPGADITTDASYISMPGGIQVFTTPGGGAPAGVPVPYSIGRPETTERFRVIWRRVPFDGWGPAATLTQRVIGTAAALGHLGSVNQTSFRGYPPLSLQLVGVEQRLLPDPTGLGYSWDIVYVMSHKPVPYGHLGFIYFPTDGTSAAYYQVERKGITTTEDPDDIADGDALFAVREFSELFVIGEV